MVSFKQFILESTKILLKDTEGLLYGKERTIVPKGTQVYIHNIERSGDNTYTVTLYTLDTKIVLHGDKIDIEEIIGEF